MIAVLGASQAAHAQNVLDRADPSVVQRDLRVSEPVLKADDAPRIRLDDNANPTAPAGITAGAIVVDGAETISAASFAPLFVDYVGRPLASGDLRELLAKVAGAARARGYVFATARIDPQPMTAGVLRITLDEGRIDAVRALGPANALVDATLRRLVTHAPATGALLERAILLVEDIPGIRVVETRYVRQDGFGILLVTIEQTRIAGIVQIDNRGSDEIGPIRSTAIGSLRSLAVGGDEASILLAQTPIDPGEFLFVQGRYVVPADARGNNVTATVAYGRTHAGGALAPFEVIGHSKSAAIGFSHPVMRARAASLWANVELRGVDTDQAVLGIDVRRDRLVTLGGSITGEAKLAGGDLRGEAGIVTGLPVGDVTRRGDPLSSRIDGSARFVRGAFSVEWLRPLGAGFSVKLASAGQLASRALLASEEFGVGGTAFGRAYDYSERTGENGVAGSLELRFDLPSAIGFVQRTQFYAFADGGRVGNLDGGVGGGGLVSAGGGARVNLGGRFDLGIEIAAPINADRFDTGDRRPRTTVRLTAVF